MGQHTGLAPRLLRLLPRHARLQRLPVVPPGGRLRGAQRHAVPVPGLPAHRPVPLPQRLSQHGPAQAAGARGALHGRWVLARRACPAHACPAACDLPAASQPAGCCDAELPASLPFLPPTFPPAHLLSSPTGSPLFFSVPKLSGYDVEIGRNFGGKFNYSCPASEVEGACVLFGGAEASAAHGPRLPRCPGGHQPPAICCRRPCSSAVEAAAGAENGGNALYHTVNNGGPAACAQ